MDEEARDVLASQSSGRKTRRHEQGGVVVVALGAILPDPEPRSWVEEHLTSIAALADDFKMLDVSFEGFARERQRFGDPHPSRKQYLDQSPQPRSVIGADVNVGEDRLQPRTQ